MGKLSKNAKQWLIAAGIVVLLLVLFVPVKRDLKDGGSYEWRALTWHYTRYDSNERLTFENGVKCTERKTGSDFTVFGLTLYESIKTDRDDYEIPDTVTPDLTEPVSPSATPTERPANTATPTPTEAPTATPTGTPVPTPTAAPDPTATGTPVPTATPAPTSTPTVTPAPTATPTPTPTSVPLDPTWKAPSGTPYGNHGKLTVKGTKIIDANGAEFQLKGVSTHGLQWFPEYVNRDTFKTIRDEWGANVIRLAMYTDENGYCVGGSAVQEKLKKVVEQGVEYATELGLYVIIDWHILHDLTPMKYVNESKAFFAEMSAKFANYGNVLYEICNEPNGGTDWPEIKQYAEIIIPVIRANNKDSIIIIGTPTWSQDVDKAAANPVSGTNLMYALHFYAGTHKDNLRQKMVAAVNAGLPVFVSEFGITDASGNGRCDIDEANKWVVVMDNYKISYVCWNLANKNESSSLIQSHVKKLSGFGADDLSVEGNWLVSILHGKMPVTDEEQEEILKHAESGGGGGEGTPKGVSARSKENGAEVSIVSTNTWQNGALSCYQLDISLKNKTGANWNGWKITVTCSTEVSSSDFWCCKYTGSGKTFVITPESWNGAVTNGGEATGIGMILSSKGPLVIESIKIEY